MTRLSRCRQWYLPAFTAALLAVGCAPANPPTRPVAVAPPAAAVSLSEYWSGIRLNDARIGFAHQRVVRGTQGLEIHTEAAFRLRLMGFDKRILEHGLDRVAPDLTLRQLEYRQQMDGNELALSGQMVDGRLVLETRNRSERERRELVVDGPLYPISALYLIPAARGLEAGPRYRFQAFDPESQQAVTVEQQVFGPEPSERLGRRAYRLESRMLGLAITTWMDRRGRPLLERSMGGALEAVLEPAEQARAYLARAALSKSETLLEFSRIPLARPIRAPADLAELTVELSGLPQRLDLQTPGRQRCAANGTVVRCRITAQTGPFPAQRAASEDLASTLQVPARHPDIRSTARAAVSGTGPGTEAQVRAVLKWIEGHIEPEPADAYGALDVLEKGRAECQGHAMLYSAMARALGIPTRMVSGVVYAPGQRGFLYHAWAESLIGGQWVAVDPTLRQFPADPTHIKLVEGEKPADAARLSALIGQLAITIAGEKPGAGGR